MSIVTISRGSYSYGKQIAEKLAERSGYECISRDILLEASEQFNIPEAKLTRAIHDAPSVLDRFVYGKERYVSYIRAAILKHVQGDNVIYHGLAGHFFLQGIPHVFKVRIIADLEDRVREEMRRESISADEARRILVADDEERRKWGLHLYGIDTRDPKLYDMILHIRNLTADDAVTLIMHCLERNSFATNPESQRILDNRVLSSQIEAVLIKDFHRVSASADGGKVVVSVQAPSGKEEETGEKVKSMVKGLPGVEDVEVYVVPIMTPD